jgi:hypothetical protein
MKTLALVPILLLALMPILFLAQASYFDMKGTVVDVLSPSSLLIGNKTIVLDDVDTTGLSPGMYAYLTNDLKKWLIGKDVFVKAGYVYLDLVGSYNSKSVNEMIQNDIGHLKDEMFYCCDWTFH